jgi:hypothetical protein
MHVIKCLAYSARRAGDTELISIELADGTATTMNSPTDLREVAARLLGAFRDVAVSGPMGIYLRINSLRLSGNSRKRSVHHDAPRG